MKARVKATGEILEIAEYSTIYLENYDSCFYPSDLEFLDVKEKSFPKDSPDYWERLKHQYAGMAMQSLIMTSTHNFGTLEQIAMWANEYATALVKELKEEK